MNASRLFFIFFLLTVCFTVAVFGQAVEVNNTEWKFTRPGQNCELEVFTREGLKIASVVCFGPDGKSVIDGKLGELKAINEIYKYKASMTTTWNSKSARPVVTKKPETWFFNFTAESVSGYSTPNNQKLTAKRHHDKLNGTTWVFKIPDYYRVVLTFYREAGKNNFKMDYRETGNENLLASIYGNRSDISENDFALNMQTKRAGTNPKEVALPELTTWAFKLGNENLTIRFPTNQTFTFTPYSENVR